MWLSMALTAALLADPTPPAPRQGFDQGHGALAELLARHVHGDRVDYAGLVADRPSLQAYLDTLAAVGADDFASWTEDQRFAFWIDAYNAFTLALVADHYPLKSIKDIGGLFDSVWDRRFIPLGALFPEVGHEKLSLNDLEHEILRARFHDARVHAAINCASQSCPPLRAEPYLAERLDRQLDDQARRWLADPTRNRYELSTGTLRLSRIFDWFEEDFRRDAGSVQAWVARYAPEEVAERIASEEPLRIRFLDYSWKLNDVER